MREVIGVDRSGGILLYPVCVIAMNIIHLRAHNDPPVTPLATYYHNDRYHQVRPTDMIQFLKTTVVFFGKKIVFLPANLLA